MVTLSLFVGIIGMLCILIAFILDEFSKDWRQNTIRYNALNVVGSALLLYYGWSLSAWPFVVLNAVWCTVAIVKLVELLVSKPHHTPKKMY